MFKVLLHKSSGEISEYATPSLQYAKRYADLYKSEFPFAEIIECADEINSVIETFGTRPAGKTSENANP